MVLFVGCGGISKMGYLKAADMKKMTDREYAAKERALNMIIDLDVYFVFLI